MALFPADDGPSEWRAMLDLNVVALCHVTQLAVAHMRRGDIRGHVVHISRYWGKGGHSGHVVHISRY